MNKNKPSLVFNSFSFSLFRNVLEKMFRIKYPVIRRKIRIFSVPPVRCKSFAVLFFNTQEKVFSEGEKTVFVFFGTNKYNGI